MFKKTRISAGLLLLAAAVHAPGVLALGLGNASVESYLNQPLRANIELIVRETDDLRSVVASLASAEDFALIGASREAISVPLRFTVEQEGEAAFIRVSSNLPVKDPVIRLIVEVNWSSGRMLREYTLFLDPPTFSSPAPSPPAAESGSDVSVAPTVAAAAPAPAQAADSGTVPTESEYTGVEAGEAEHGPVQAGETLWRIASDWSRGSGLNINQVMLAIQRNNPQAFINGNINLLKRGAILRMPLPGEVEEIPVEAARTEVVQQTQAFQGNALPSAVDTPLVDESSEAVVSMPDDEPGEAEDRLELVPPSEASDIDSAYGFEESQDEADAGASVQALREELARAEEELIAEQQTNQNLLDRIDELEGQLAAAEEGNVADAELAQMQSDLREQRLAEEESEAAAPAAPAPVNPAVPQVRSSSQAKNQDPWYSSLMVWVIGLLVLGAAVAGWFLSRRAAEPLQVSDIGGRRDETVRGIKDEAEGILRVLEPTGEAPRPQPPAEPVEAELLDEESADPEVRLDLARAYVAMGDKEAARVILAEVIEHGNAEQKAEANAMLGEF